MKILKPGTLPAERKYVGTCRNCGCVAEARESEVRVCHDQREGTTASGCCPQCKARMSFDPSR